MPVLNLAGFLAMLAAALLVVARLGVGAGSRLAEHNLAQVEDAESVEDYAVRTIAATVETPPVTSLAHVHPEWGHLDDQMFAAHLAANEGGETT